MLRRTWALLGWSALLLALVWGLRHLEQQVTAPRSDVRCRLEWVDLPPWLAISDNQWVGNEIEAAANLRPDDDIRDPQLCARVGKGLESSPWVAGVQRVTKRPNGAVRVDATFREPFAFIAVRGRAYLVDEAGVRLPSECMAAAIDPEDWLTITGVAEPIPDVGQAWGGRDLAGGLALVRYLRNAVAQGRLPFRSSLRAVDVANYDGAENTFDAKLRLRTIHPRCYIRWGEPPGEEYPVQPSADRKLEMLASVYADRGQLPEGVLDVLDPEGRKVRIEPPDDGD